MKEEVEEAEVTASITLPSVGRGFPAGCALRLGEDLKANAGKLLNIKKAASSNVKH